MLIAMDACGGFIITPLRKQVLHYKRGNGKIKIMRETRASPHKAGIGKSIAYILLCLGIACFLVIACPINGNAYINIAHKPH